MSDDLVERLRQDADTQENSVEMGSWYVAELEREAADELEWMQVTVAVWRAFASLHTLPGAGDVVDTIMLELRRQAADARFSPTVIAGRIDEFLYGPTGLIGGMG